MSPELCCLVRSNCNVVFPRETEMERRLSAERYPRTLAQRTSTPLHFAHPLQRIQQAQDRMKRPVAARSKPFGILAQGHTTNAVASSSGAEINVYERWQGLHGQELMFMSETKKGPITSYLEARLMSNAQSGPLAGHHRPGPPGGRGGRRNGPGGPEEIGPNGTPTSYILGLITALLGTIMHTIGAWSQTWCGAATEPDEGAAAFSVARLWRLLVPRLRASNGARHTAAASGEETLNTKSGCLVKGGGRTASTSARSTTGSVPSAHHAYLAAAPSATGASASVTCSATGVAGVSLQHRGYLALAPCEAVTSARFACAAAEAADTAGASFECCGVLAVASTEAGASAFTACAAADAAAASFERHGLLALASTAAVASARIACTAADTAGASFECCGVLAVASSEAGASAFTVCAAAEAAAASFERHGILALASTAAGASARIACTAADATGVTFERCGVLAVASTEAGASAFTACAAAKAAAASFKRHGLLALASTAAGASARIACTAADTAGASFERCGVLAVASTEAGASAFTACAAAEAAAASFERHGLLALASTAAGASARIACTAADATGVSFERIVYLGLVSSAAAASARLACASTDASGACFECRDILALASFEAGASSQIACAAADAVERSFELCVALACDSSEAGASAYTACVASDAASTSFERLGVTLASPAADMAAHVDCSAAGTTGASFELRGFLELAPAEAGPTAPSLSIASDGGSRQPKMASTSPAATTPLDPISRTNGKPSLPRANPGNHPSKAELKQGGCGILQVPSNNTSTKAQKHSSSNTATTAPPAASRVAFGRKIPATTAASTPSRAGSTTLAKTLNPPVASTRPAKTVTPASNPRAPRSRSYLTSTSGGAANSSAARPAPAGTGAVGASCDRNPQMKPPKGEGAAFTRKPSVDMGCHAARTQSHQPATGLGAGGGIFPKTPTLVPAMECNATLLAHQSLRQRRPSKLCTTITPPVCDDPLDCDLLLPVPQLLPTPTTHKPPMPDCEGGVSTGADGLVKSKSAAPQLISYTAPLDLREAIERYDSAHLSGRQPVSGSGLSQEGAAVAWLEAAPALNALPLAQLRRHSFAACVTAAAADVTSRLESAARSRRLLTHGSADLLHDSGTPQQQLSQPETCLSAPLLHDNGVVQRFEACSSSATAVRASGTHNVCVGGGVFAEGQVDGLEPLQKVDSASAAAPAPADDGAHAHCLGSITLLDKAHVQIPARNSQQLLAKLTDQENIQDNDVAGGEVRQFPISAMASASWAQHSPLRLRNPVLQSSANSPAKNSSCRLGETASAVLPAPTQSSSPRLPEGAAGSSTPDRSSISDVLPKLSEHLKPSSYTKPNGSDYSVSNGGRWKDGGTSGSHAKTAKGAYTHGAQAPLGSTHCSVSRRMAACVPSSEPGLDLERRDGGLRDSAVLVSRSESGATWASSVAGGANSSRSSMTSGRSSILRASGSLAAALARKLPFVGGSSAVTTSSSPPRRPRGGSGWSHVHNTPAGLLYERYSDRHLIHADSEAASVDGISSANSSPLEAAIGSRTYGGGNGGAAAGSVAGGVAAGGTVPAATPQELALRCDSMRSTAASAPARARVWSAVSVAEVAGNEEGQDSKPQSTASSEAAGAIAHIVVGTAAVRKLSVGSSGTPSTADARLWADQVRQGAAAKLGSARMGAGTLHIDRISTGRHGAEAGAPVGHHTQACPDGLWNGKANNAGTVARGLASGSRGAAVPGAGAGKLPRSGEGNTERVSAGCGGGKTKKTLLQRAVRKVSKTFKLVPAAKQSA